MFLVNAFKEIGFDVFEPEGAFYVFPKIPAELGMGSEDFAYELIMRKKVLVVPGEAFSDAGAGFLRCCYATSMEKLKIAMKHIADFVAEIKAEKNLKNN